MGENGLPAPAPVAVGGPGWRGELAQWMDAAPHAYLSCACLHGRHAECGRLQHERGDGAAPHCKFCPAVCLCLVCRHEGAPAAFTARAFHSGYGGHRRGGQVRRLHIVREDGRAGGRQAMCGQAAGPTLKAPVVVYDPMPATPPPGLTWCPSCIGHLAERTNRIEALAALLAATGVAG